MTWIKDFAGQTFILDVMNITADIIKQLSQLNIQWYRKIVQDLFLATVVLIGIKFSIFVNQLASVRTKLSDYYYIKYAKKIALFPSQNHVFGIKKSEIANPGSAPDTGKVNRRKEELSILPFSLSMSRLSRFMDQLQLNRSCGFRFARLRIGRGYSPPSVTCPNHCFND